MKIIDWLFNRIDEATIENKAYTIVGDVTEQLYFQELAFYIAVSYIADTISKCEFKVYKNGEEVKDELYYRLNVSPNDNESANQFKNKLVNRILYDGEALVIMLRNRLYCADSFGTDEHPLGHNIYDNITVGTESIRKRFRSSDAFYFRLDDKNIRSLTQTVASGYQKVLDYAYSAFTKQNGEKYKLKIDSVKAGDEQFNEEFNNYIKKQVENFINSPRAVYPEFTGYNLEKIDTGATTTTDSSDIRNIKKDAFETTAQAFKMPVSMLYGNMTNVKDIVNAYITFTIEPIARMIGTELTRKTSTMEGYLSGNYVKVDISSIYYVDVFDVADKTDKMISSGLYCVDEIREKLGENLLNTEFSKQHWITKNYSTSENAMNSELNQSTIQPVERG